MVTKFTQFQPYPVMINHLKQYWKVYAWCALITILSCLPADNKGSDWFDFQHADKILHFVFYGIFSALIIMSISPIAENQHISIRTIIIAFIMVLSYGSIIELVQHYLVSARTGDPVDILFNLAGWIFAVALMYLRTRVISKNLRS